MESRGREESRYQHSSFSCDHRQHCIGIGGVAQGCRGHCGRGGGGGDEEELCIPPTNKLANPMLQFFLDTSKNYDSDVAKKTMKQQLQKFRWSIVTLDRNITCCHYLLQ